MTDRRVLLVSALLGGLLYAYLAFFRVVDGSSEQFGQMIYNYYFLSLMDGRFDVPARIIGIEGHYDPAGRAFVYHGLAPVITRLFLAPFVDLAKVSLSAFTIWLFTLAGTVVYQSLFLRVLATARNAGDAPGAIVTAMISAMVWLVSPGIFLVSNNTIYHEPLAVAYFTTACCMALFTWGSFSGGNWSKILVWMAFFAGLTVFARPNAAVGLYLGVTTLAAYLLLAEGRKPWLAVMAAMLLLMTFGLALLAFNQARFGNPFTMHGAMHSASLEYGNIFFGIESENSPRSLAFAQHGQFNIARVIPNLMLYFADFPASEASGIFARILLWLDQAYESMTASLGTIRIESPTIGVAYLWLPWVVVVLFGITRIRRMPATWSIAILAVAANALLLASYGTVTFRYRFEFWPLMVATCIAVLPGLLKFIRAEPRIKVLLVGTVALALIASLGLTYSVTLWYSRVFNPNGYYSAWSYETCRQLVAAKEGLGEGAVERICSLTPG